MACFFLLSQSAGPTAWQNFIKAGGAKKVPSEKMIKFKDSTDVYYGQINHSTLPHGFGTLVYETDGSIYVGDWVNGLKEGKGTLYYGN